MVNLAIMLAMEGNFCWKLANQDKVLSNHALRRAIWFKAIQDFETIYMLLHCILLLLVPFSLYFYEFTLLFCQ